MMNSYFEQSGFYGGHGVQTGVGAEQAYRFPLGLGVNPYGATASAGAGGRHVGVQESQYDAAAAAAAAASCQKLYEQQYKLQQQDTGPKDVGGGVGGVGVNGGYGSIGSGLSGLSGVGQTGVGSKDSAISSWAAAAAAAAAAICGYGS